MASWNVLGNDVQLIPSVLNAETVVVVVSMIGVEPQQWLRAVYRPSTPSGGVSSLSVSHKRTWRNELSLLMDSSRFGMNREVSKPLEHCCMASTLQVMCSVLHVSSMRSID